VYFCNNLFTDAFTHLLTPDQVQLTPQGSYMLQSEELGWWQLNGSRQELRASALAAGLHSLRASNTQVWDKRVELIRDAEWRDMAVLCRSNTEAQKLSDACVAQGIPVALSRAGLIEAPEVLLALASLRRLADTGDSLASADILSFATGSNAESWLTTRIDAVNAGDQRAWDDGADPILTRLAEARNDIGALSPAEALSLAMQVADIHQIVLGWDESTRLTEHRLANLQRLKTLAIEYEDHCKANHVAGTTAGFLLWLRALEQGFTDDQAQNPGNAVTIATYHKAKGLEWPIVVCASLDANLKVSLYGVRVTAASSQFDWNDPLAGRDLVYWPNPFPEQKGKDPLTQQLQQTPEWADAEQQARNEGIQLLYVGMTRARDQLILTQENNKAIGDWLGLLDTSYFPLTGGTLNFRCGHSAETATLALSAPDTPAPNAGLRARHWLPQCTGPAKGTTPYFRPPSSEEASTTPSCTIEKDFGWRLTLAGNQDMEQVGIALHHCLAIVLANPAVSSETVTTILQQYPAVCLDADEILKRGHSSPAELTLPWKRMIHGSLSITSQILSLLQNGRKLQASTLVRLVHIAMR
jgi:ATP-dependent exoDNAse (exonuclease V) beta subunit